MAHPPQRLGASLVILAILALTTPILAGDPPVAFWPFEEGSGQAVHDVSGQGNDGQLVGASRTVAGISGDALSFDGFNDWVEIPEQLGVPVELSNLSQGSISVWFYLDPLPPTSSLRPIFYLGNGDISPNDSALVIELGHGAPGGSVLYFTLYDNASTPFCFDSNFDLSPGQWYHFVGVVGPNFNTGYLNGVEMIDRDYNWGDPSTHLFISDVPETGYLWLGKGYAKELPDMKYHDGLIDEVRIYDRPLTATEVANLYDSTISGGTGFIRGDANGDTSFDIADPIATLGELFGGSGPGLVCADAADTNDDGTVDIADPIYALGNLFTGGPTPSEPFPFCGIDPTADNLPCVQSAACP